MTELAALNIRITGDSADLSAAVSRATGDLQKIEGAAKRANTATSGMATGMGRGGAAMASLSANSKQLSWQLSQIVQQGTVTGQWATAFAVQLGDIVPLLAGGGLLAVGISSLAMVGLPLLAGAFMDSGEKALTLGEQVDELSGAVSSYVTASKAARQTSDELAAAYGSLATQANAALNAIASAERLAALQTLNTTVQNIATSFGTFEAAVDGMIGSAWEETLFRLRDELDLSGDAAYRVGQALEALSRAQGPEQIAQAAARVREELLAAGVAANSDLVRGLNAAQNEALRLAGETEKAAAAANVLAGNMGSAYAVYAQTRNMAAALADETARAAMAAASFASYQSEIANAGQASGPDAARTMTQFGGGRFAPLVSGAGLATPKAKGGGGGAKKNPIVAELEALQNALMTAEQSQIDSFARQQKTLRSALEQRLITQQEYNALMEEAQRQHSEAMAQIDAYRYGDTLLQAETFMGDMAEAMAMGNEKMQKAARKFAAVEALINAWRAYSQTLADPSLPFLAKFAAAAKVLAAGMGAVNAIKGSGGGGGGGAGAGAAATVTENRTANIYLQGGYGPINQDTVRMIANGLNDWLGDGGRLNVGTY